MNDLRTAAQQALEQVQEFKRRWWLVPAFGNKVNKATREAITNAHSPIFELEHALRAALAEPLPPIGKASTDVGVTVFVVKKAESVQPVAWLVTTEMQDGTRRTYPLTGRFEDVKDACDFGEPVPLYAAPPQRKPLTEEEALDIARTFGAQPWPPGSCVAFARAIEAAHGIK